MFLFCSNIEMGRGVEGGCACQGLAVDLVSCRRKQRQILLQTLGTVKACSGRERGKAPVWRPARYRCGDFCCRFPADAANALTPTNPGVRLTRTPPDRPSLPRLRADAARPELTKPAGAGSTPIRKD